MFIYQEKTISHKTSVQKQQTTANTIVHIKSRQLLLNANTKFILYRKGGRFFLCLFQHETKNFSHNLFSNKILNLLITYLYSCPNLELSQVQALTHTGQIHSGDPMTQTSCKHKNLYHIIKFHVEISTRCQVKH